MNPKKPTFLIIGSSKCGTTTLADVLADHPDCCMGRPKEVRFFQEITDCDPNPNYDKGWEWYSQAFGHYQGEPVIGEATPAYSERSRSPQTARRIFEFNPGMKIIYMVRDPMDRQVSAWRMHHFEGVNGETALPFPGWALQGFDYWTREMKKVKEWDECRYGFQLAAYHEFFPREQILVSFLKDLKQHRDQELARISRFLSLDPARLPAPDSAGSNRAEDRKIERPWFKRLRSSPVARATARILPQVLRYKAVGGLGTEKWVPPQPDLSPDTRQEFLSYVSADARKFLQDWGKPPGFWPSIQD